MPGGGPGGSGRCPQRSSMLPCMAPGGPGGPRPGPPRAGIGPMRGSPIRGSPIWFHDPVRPIMPCRPMGPPGPMDPGGPPMGGMPGPPLGPRIHSSGPPIFPLGARPMLPRLLVRLRPPSYWSDRYSPFSSPGGMCVWASRSVIRKSRVYFLLFSSEPAATAAAGRLPEGVGKPSAAFSQSLSDTLDSTLVRAGSTLSAGFSTGAGGAGLGTENTSAEAASRDSALSYLSFFTAFLPGPVCTGEVGASGLGSGASRSRADETAATATAARAAAAASAFSFVSAC
mmetsp:Transcript_29269/g.75119  ORF Transcript_29269/g.75119 Transcript_29269/m.75119 type:complete len:284 (-) Transcript_29269:1520-2371(-)